VNVEKFIPIIRDVVFLAGGTFVFVREALHEARWGPMLLAMVFAAGPAAILAYWSTVRIPANGSSASPPSPSPSSLPSSSSSSGEA
jgi:hypothetical protein